MNFKQKAGWAYLGFSRIRRLFCIVLASGTLSACNSMPIKLPSLGEQPIEIAQRFFEVYAERQDFEALMDFYDDAAVLEDMIYGHYAHNKADIRAFLNWSDPKFYLAEGRPALEISSMTAQGSRVVAQGAFQPFSYDQKPHGPWRFVIILEFNEQGKIRREIDWINYTPKESFLGGVDMNTRNQSESE